MKNIILATALGIVAPVAPSYGQGSIFFNNYGATTDAIVTCSGRFGLVPVSSGWTAGLRYGLGTITDPALLILSGITQAFNPATPGYFQGPIVTIPGYSGGPITFQVLALAALSAARSNSYTIFTSKPTPAPFSK